MKLVAITATVQLTVAKISDHISSTDFAAIQNYGCWCHWQDDRPVGGHGQPIDEIDAWCKSLSQGYDCCEHDNDETTSSFGECEPQTISYSPSNYDINSLVQNCDTSNDISSSFCANCACKVEGLFVSKWNEFKNNSGLVNPNNQGNNFDREAECQVLAGRHDPQWGKLEIGVK